MSKRASSGAIPPAKKVHSFFTSGPAIGEKPVTRGTFDKTAPKTLIHYHHRDPLAAPPPSDPVTVVLYDLDGCLIVPNSGLKFPRDQNDWKWWNPVVPKRLAEDVAAGKHVIVLSNQGTGDKKLQNWKLKLELIAAKLGADLPFRVLAATSKDIFRKPSTGMFDFVVKLYEEKGWKIDHEKTIFVGDAAGRKGDHSDTDFTMALNAGIAFATPEEHFLGLKPVYPNPPKGFRPSTMKDLGNLPAVVPSSTPIARTEKEVVVFVGLPASGKTSFYRNHFAAYEHINQDTLKSRDACIRAARQKLEIGKSVVIDNTNRNKATRAFYVKLAKEYNVPIRLFWFQCPLELARHNSTYRALHGPKDEPVRDILPGLAFNSYIGDFDPPKESEGFDEVRKVNFVWEGSEEQRKKWDQYLF